MRAGRVRGLWATDADDNAAEADVAQFTTSLTRNPTDLAAGSVLDLRLKGFPTRLVEPRDEWWQTDR